MAEQVDVLTNVQANLSEECLVLLEEVITSNRKLAKENMKVMEEHERNSKTHAEVLKWSSSSWREKEMLEWEMVLKDVSIVKDRPRELWYQLNVHVE